MKICLSEFLCKVMLKVNENIAISYNFPHINILWVCLCLCFVNDNCVPANIFITCVLTDPLMQSPSETINKLHVTSILFQNVNKYKVPNILYLHQSIQKLPRVCFVSWHYDLRTLKLCRRKIRVPFTSVVYLQNKLIQ